MTATNKTFAILSDTQKSQIKTVILEHVLNPIQYLVEQQSKISRIPNSHQPQPFYQCNLACNLKELLDIFLHFVSENSSMTAAKKTFVIFPKPKKSNIKTSFWKIVESNGTIYPEPHSHINRSRFTNVTSLLN